MLCLTSVLAIPGIAYGIYLAASSSTPEKDINNLISGLNTNSVGSRFNSYVLSDRKDPAWDEQMISFKVFNKQIRNHIHLDDYFKTNTGEIWSKETLQNKCQEAYQRERWSDIPKGSDKDKYWDSVRTFCFRKNEVAAGWNQGD